MGGFDIHFITSNVTEEDKELFFGPLESNDKFITIEPNWLMAHILFHAGIFKSISQARKNGGNVEIPSGFSHITRGKKANKKQIYILNIKE